MPDWSASMQQTYEYYLVDPNTWKEIRLLNNFKTCTVTRDSEADTLGSATFDIEGNTGECYVRPYLVTIQNGITEKHSLGTFLVQTPSLDFDGKESKVSVDAYTPLLELKEKKPQIGYSLLINDNIMDKAYRLVRDNLRAPVIKPTCDTILYNNFVANTDDTQLAFIIDLMANANYIFGLDELSRVLFVPYQKTISLQPVWEYNDDNSSILYPEISMNQDFYGIPNVVEVLYSYDSGYYYAKVVNDDPSSLTSTVNRGREIIYRVTDPELSGSPSNNEVQEYAKSLLVELSSLEYTLTYTHGYCPVRLGDCVRLNYSKAKIENVKAKVINQTIKCEAGCPVTEKAIFTNSTINDIKVYGIGGDS